MKCLLCKQIEKKSQSVIQIMSLEGDTDNHVFDT